MTRIHIPAVPVDLDPNVREGMLKDKAFLHAQHAAISARQAYCACSTEASGTAYGVALLHLVHLMAIIEEYGSPYMWIDLDEDTWFDLDWTEAGDPVVPVHVHVTGDYQGAAIEYMFLNDMGNLDNTNDN